MLSSIGFGGGRGTTRAVRHATAKRNSHDQLTFYEQEAELHPNMFFAKVLLGIVRFEAGTLCALHMHNMPEDCNVHNLRCKAPHIVSHASALLSGLVWSTRGRTFLYLRFCHKAICISNACFVVSYQSSKPQNSPTPCFLQRPVFHSTLTSASDGNSYGLLIQE